MITVLKAPDMGQPSECAWQFRVHLSKEEDWSGSAATEDEAWAKAKALRDERAAIMRDPAYQWRRGATS